MLDQIYSIGDSLVIEIPCEAIKQNELELLENDNLFNITSHLRL